MQTPHGFTLIEVIIALAIVVIGASVIILFTKPFEQFDRFQDRQRAGDVRNYTEALLELRQTEPDTFEDIVQLASSSKVMIGENDCSGDFGMHCSDVEVLDSCLSLGYLEPYLNYIFVEKAAGYSDLQTGYYLKVDDGVMRIGSCEAVELARVDITISL